MKVILYMAMTANGYIAKENDDTSWVSKEEWNSYSAAVQKARNMIIGHRTYGILTTQPEFSELKDVKIVVLSHSDIPMLNKNHVVAHSPSEALKILEGNDEIIVAGGGFVNAAFLSQGLIGEIYLDVEPTILGSGIQLLKNGDFETKLELLGTKQFSPNEIQLHYKVVR
ncbi:MAG TPA: dihydrofolate reductase family protein [Candidatus Paceibacterota bacterium]|nr:dihydrofolate reductase family protein [Candidatus Paceibacterota bacterium]